MTLNLIDNERKILALLSKSKQLTKRELQKDGGMSWSTVTKIVNRLLEKSLIEESGIKVQNIQGKDAVTYSLKFDCPLFLSMDISYDYLKVMLTNLGGERIVYYEELTPKFENFKDLVSFFKKFIEEFLSKINGKKNDVKGIGISLPLFLIGNPDEKLYIDLKKEVSEYFKIDVEVTNSSNSYCYYLKFKGELFKDQNQVMILNRGGLGASFIIDNEIVTGSNNLTGEIGHWKLGENQEQCRCGQVGCVENDLDFIKFMTRAVAYIEKVRGSIPREDEILSCFKGYLEKKDPEAVEMVDLIVSSYLKIINLISVSLDINHFTIVGLWGELEEYLMERIKYQCCNGNFLNKKINISYRKFDEHNFISRGPVFNLLNNYFID